MADDTIEYAPPSDIRPAQVKIDPELSSRIVSSFRSAYDQALSDRQALDDMILVAERNWEMTTIERTFPWKGASNVFIPIIPEQVMAVTSGTKADVFTPGGFFLLIGEDEEAQARSHTVQRHYNAKLTMRQKMGRTWLQEAEDYVLLAALHGTSYMDVTYLKKKSWQKYEIAEDEVDADGNTVLDSDGKPKKKWAPYDVEVTDYDGVLWEALELRDIILIPARSKSLGEAYAIVRVMYLTEDDLMQMSRPTQDGTKPLLDRAMVEYIVKGSVAKGDSERTQDPRGMETYTDGGEVQATTQPFTDDVMGRLLTTEYEVLRIETSAIDIDGDGSGDHMIFFMHRQPEAMLGAIRFPYTHGKHLTVDLSLMRRPKRAYGFGVPERLRTIQTEYNANFNMGNDSSNLRLMPPRYQEEGVKVLGTDNGEWGPGVTFIGQKSSVGILELPDILPSNERIREELMSMAQRISNQTPPSAQGARVTKAGVQAAQAKQNAYQSTMSENVRYALADILDLTMALDLQFGPETMTATSMVQGKPVQTQITKADLALPYQKLINGMGGPQDLAADRNDRMLLHQMFAGRPDYANDPERLYKLDDFLLESFPMADKETLIGTPQQAQQRAQAQQQAQAEQKAKEEAMQAAGHQGGAGAKKPAGGGMQPSPLGQ